jgi:hypothetical protein
LNKSWLVLVRQGEAPTARNVKNKIPPSVAATDHEHFVQMVLNEFKALHAGNVVRFGLRPLEFSTWQDHPPREE